jgi:RES domain-containing protein
LRLDDLPSTYKLIQIRFPDSLPQSEVRTRDLPTDWRDRIEVTRSIGDAWLTEGTTPLLWVPSVVVPETMNLLVNPIHARSRRIRIVSVRQFQFDPRLK